jgi:hypothetical protein
MRISLLFTCIAVLLSVLSGCTSNRSAGNGASRVAREAIQALASRDEQTYLANVRPDERQSGLGVSLDELAGCRVDDAEVLIEATGPSEARTTVIFAQACGIGATKECKMLLDQLSDRWYLVSSGTLGCLK